jgi:hypothetical protein
MTGDKQAEERVNTSVRSPLEALDQYEALVVELARKPRFVQAEPSGESFIIGGQNPQASKLSPE